MLLRSSLSDWSAEDGDPGKSFFGKEGNTMNDQSVLVELDQIQDNPYQQRQDEDTDAIAEIAVSIFRNGLLQIPSARRANGHYELVFGHTRKAAYRLLATKRI